MRYIKIFLFALVLASCAGYYKDISCKRYIYGDYYFGCTIDSTIKGIMVVESINRELYVVDNDTTWFLLLDNPRFIKEDSVFVVFENDKAVLYIDKSKNTHTFTKHKTR